MDSKLEPANDDHPSHDVYQGQAFVKEVYETLRASPQWNETMLVITYDEHGGFFDHVPTPVRGVPSPDGVLGQEPFYFKFDQLGVRVPTIVVSPWIEKGTVVHGPKGSPSPTPEYEHSSIPATVKKIFNLNSPFLTNLKAFFKPELNPELIAQVSHLNFDQYTLATPNSSEDQAGRGQGRRQDKRVPARTSAACGRLKGDDILTTYADGFGKQMTVREGKKYMEDAVKSFFEAGLAAKELGVDEEQIVKMRPSLTTRSPKPYSEHP
ncbi:hypothetical protein RJ640_018210 [Escallonia rubra]|uniref:Uncharacterized protein n=1 Tax=Escallonia rubra TaxID=112253 RepID=A0AA88QX86_9ASTE|nr:hypothetical protein RJ640_018210 [Escallonia rubra]